MEALGQVLADICPDWKVSFAGEKAAAFSILESTACDVVIVCVDLPGPDDLSFLTEIARKHPHTLRFLMSDCLNQELFLQSVLNSHRFLSKPCEPLTLKNAINQWVTINEWLPNAKMKELVSRIRTFPSFPSLYMEVARELESEQCSAQKLGEVIAKDMAICSKMLQVLNSPLFALPRQITDPAEAVNILGFSMVKSLVLCIQIFAEFDKIKPCLFSISQMWTHSNAVAQAARKIANCEGMGIDIVEEAYTAGLFHDIGKLVLACNFSDEYQNAMDTARKEKIALGEAERRIFGCSHAEIGAYLLGFWGLPLGICEAAAFHHDPSSSKNTTPGTLLAVHAANVLIGQSQNKKEGIVPEFDVAYLQNLKLKDHVPQWSGQVLGDDATTKLAADAATRNQSNTTSIPKKRGFWERFLKV